MNISRTAEYFTACYTVLKRPNKVETAVHGCNLAFSLDSIVSLPHYAFYVVSALHHCLLVFLFLADQIFYRSYVDRQHFRLRVLCIISTSPSTLLHFFPPPKLSSISEEQSKRPKQTQLNATFTFQLKCVFRLKNVSRAAGQKTR